MSDEHSVEKMRKYVTIKNNTMSPFKKDCLSAMVKLRILILRKSKVYTKPTENRLSQNSHLLDLYPPFFRRILQHNELSNDIIQFLLHNRKEVAASYEFKEKLNVILEKKIKGQSKKGMEYFETKGDT